MTWTLMQLFLACVLCDTWRVEYQQQRICAVKGSSVVIPCLFHHPESQTVKRVMWGYVKFPHTKGRFVSDSSLNKVTRRFQYIGDKRLNCSLKIQQVEHNDAGIYTVRFSTGNKKGKRLSDFSPTLKVVDLNISMTKPNVNGTVKEGDSINLTCINSCDDLSSAFTWFKSGEPFSEGPVLYLSNMSSTNSGNYTCSLKTHTGTTSGVINIDVEYGPKNTSVSVRPSLEIDPSSNFTMICSSHANPPVENYTWFKIDEDDNNAVGHQPLFLSAEGGQYFCTATNKHGSQNSSVVTLKIKKYQATPNSKIYLLILPLVAVLLIVTAVIALRRLNKKRTTASEADREDDTENAVYANWPVLDKNQSQEGSQSEGATVELIYAMVDFHTKRKSNMQQHMDSHPDDEDVIYSTVCKSQPSYSSEP
ncbi:B-cell receptor CD22 isoform X3 [Dicentrarchus labrax]|uniref:B-cell receptor CD22 isoform X3 n=1 Tax=Dicentrarchus labrax TaxID=13489 RepID=UPI0021F5933A|nr:B-cell receptor CD22 isoform X3 [Dicentrarchus labrax]